MNARKLILGGAAAAVIAVAVGIAAWWFLIREDNELATNAPEVPTDLVQTPSAGETPSVDATPSSSGDGLTFVVIPERSEAAYFADEQLASLPVPSTAKGTTTAIEGQFHLSEDGIALDPSQPSTFTVDLTTLKSDQDRRDNRVQGALETTTFPTATFTATSVSGFDDSLAEGAEQTMTLTGTLDLHGVQKEVTWELKVKREANVITGLATLNFRYDEFNIEEPSIGGFVSVEEDVTLQIQIVAQAS